MALSRRRTFSVLDNSNLQEVQEAAVAEQLDPPALQRKPRPLPETTYPSVSDKRTVRMQRMLCMLVSVLTLLADALFRALR